MDSYAEAQEIKFETADGKFKITGTVGYYVANGKPVESPKGDEKGLSVVIIRPDGKPTNPVPVKMLSKKTKQILFRKSGPPIVKVPTNGLVAYYPFNGNAKDESGNGNHGKIEGVALTLDRHGHENAAYRFKSTGDRIAVRNSLRGLTASSLSLHVSCSQPTEQFCVLAAVGNIGTGTVFELGMGGDQKILKIRQLQLSSSLGVNTKKSMQSFDRWYHVVLTQADDVAKMYVDGILVDILSSKTVVINGPAEQSLIFGSKWEGGIYPVGYGMWQYRGSLDDVRIYNRALSDNEVKSLYKYESRNK